jgi:hypothetical protein
MSGIPDSTSAMIHTTASQMQHLGDQAFRERLRASLARNDVDFAAMSAAAQHAFVAASHGHARLLGLRSEQAVAAYALGALWLGVGFEEASPLLQRLLRTSVPEVRKAHAMSEWVRDQLGATSTPQSGDAAIRKSFALTAPWGVNGP